MSVQESNNLDVVEEITLEKYEGDVDENGVPGPNAVHVETVKVQNGKVVEVIDRRRPVDPPGPPDKDV